MPLYLIERNIAELLQLSREAAEPIERVNEEIGVEWLPFFLRAYNEKTFCIYKVKEPEALIDHARTLGIPANVIVEISKNRSSRAELG